MLGTYIVFRIGILAWMTRWIVVNKDLIPLVLYSLGSIGNVLIRNQSLIITWGVGILEGVIRRRPIRRTCADYKRPRGPVWEGPNVT